jgi:hypothetical protein
MSNAPRADTHALRAPVRSTANVPPVLQSVVDRSLEKGAARRGLRLRRAAGLAELEGVQRTI